LAIYVVYRVRAELGPMLRRVGHIEAFGVKLSVSGEQALNAAVEMARKLADPTLDVPEADRKRALDRAKREHALLDGAELLWVDDTPSNNRNEARMLRSFGAVITFAASTAEAMHALRLAAEQAQPFSLILSDISRAPPDAERDAGIRMLAALRGDNVALPVIFYVARRLDAGMPGGAFGLTNRPDELLHLTLDALSRTRGVAA